MNSSGDPTFCQASAHSALAFTLTELLVVLAVVSLLLVLRLSALGNAKDQALIAACAGNLRELTQTTIIYANENGDKFPPSGGVASWPWDMAWNVGNTFTQNIVLQRMYCPASGMTPEDNISLWNFGAPSFHVIGYSTTFPGISLLVQTNVNNTLTPRRIQNGAIYFPAPSAANRVLFADATLSTANSPTPAANFTHILGGFAKAHRTDHLDGLLPSGGNVGMLDGHVEWRGFSQMVPRTTIAPYFWW